MSDPVFVIVCFIVRVVQGSALGISGKLNIIMFKSIKFRFKGPYSDSRALLSVIGPEAVLLSEPQNQKGFFRNKCNILIYMKELSCYVAELLIIILSEPQIVSTMSTLFPEWLGTVTATYELAFR